ncbi:hypothetical protein XENOCAPTIV_008824, partial [Xenoophorus captivus]
TVESEEGLGQVLQQMGIESGQNISFQDFWTLINKQAVQTNPCNRCRKVTKRQQNSHRRVLFISSDAAQVCVFGPAVRLSVRPGHLLVHQDVTESFTC